MRADDLPRELPLLELAPLYKAALWGGRRLGSALGRALPVAGPVGESWEVVDLPGDQSTVAGGPLAGRTLGEIRAARRDALLGAAAELDGRFPLLVKFVDARDRLSVQVHPGPAACAALGGGARPKTEAWLVMACAPGAALYAGLRPGVDRAGFAAALAAGEIDTALARREVRPGDLVFVPAGTVHAIGAGVLLAEIQQASDTTYRVFDWDRRDADGRPRELHVAQALASIDFAAAGEPPAALRSGRRGLACAAFSMEVVPPAELAGGCVLASDGPLILVGVGGAGTAEVRAGDETRRIGLGRTLLVPACRAGRVELAGRDPVEILAVRAGP